MICALDHFREFNLASITLRLFLALLLGGMIGLERGRKGRAAGLRTYSLVCMGAVLTMLLGQYNYVMMETTWAHIATEIGVRTDISRFGAQVINGIGFLGAGTIIVTGRQQVKGLTTAAGLWASACMGLAVGAGFYECVLLSVSLIFFCIRVLPHLEVLIIERARNMNLYIEFEAMDEIGTILTRVKSQAEQIFSVEINRGQEDRNGHPNAVLSVRLKKRRSHAQVIAAIAELDNIFVIEEL